MFNGLLLAMLMGDLPVINTGHDKIPDFAASPTCETVASGYWFWPLTWKGLRIPGPDDIVVVNAGHKVTIGATARCHTLGVHGEVEQFGNLHAANVLVYEDGSYSHRLGEIVIRDVPPIDTEQFGTGLICLGKFSTPTVLDGPSSTNATPKLIHSADESIKAGDQIIQVDKLSGTFPGMPVTVYLADTREKPWHYEGKCWLDDGLEVEVIEGSIGVGVITLQQPTRFAHSNAVPIGVVPQYMQPKIRSENPEGNRGHVMFAGHAEVNLTGLQIIDMGRTTANALHPVNNHIGRYALHLHHLHQPFSVSRCSVIRPLRWGIAVHDSKDGLVEQTFVFDAQGAGIVTEQGSEVRVWIIDNLAMLVRGYPGLSINQRQEESSQKCGAGFWFNIARACECEDMLYVERNIAVNTKGPGFNLFCPMADDSSVRSATGIVMSRRPQMVENTAAFCANGYELWNFRDSISINGCDATNCQRGLVVPFVADAELDIYNCRFYGSQYTPVDQLEPDERWCSMGLQIDGTYLKSLCVDCVSIEGFDYGIWDKLEWVHDGTTIVESGIVRCRVGVFMPQVHYTPNGEYFFPGWKVAVSKLLLEDCRRPLVLGIWQPQFGVSVELPGDDSVPIEAETWKAVKP